MDAWPGWEDGDLEETLEAWRRLDEDAVRILRRALASYVGVDPPRLDLEQAAESLRRGWRAGGHPYDMLAAVGGFPAEGRPDEEVVLAAAAALVDPLGDPGLDIHQEAATMSLEHADWLGAVVELVREGPGAAVEPERMVAYIDRCPEVEGSVDPEDADVLAVAFVPVVDLWQAAGLVDAGHRLTRLGVWALPRGLAQAWGGEFDEGADPR